MATSYRALIYSAVSNATRGMVPETSPAVDAESIAESLFPLVSQSVCEAAAADPAKRSQLRRLKALTLVAGEATLSDDVLTKYFSDATLLGTSLSQKYAFRDYPDFVRKGDLRLGCFTRNGTTIMVRDPGQQFAVPLTATGTRTLIVPCVVVKPTLPDDALNAPDEITSDLIEALGDALKGALVKLAGEAV